MLLTEILESAEDGFDGRLGAAILHLGTGEEASLNGDELFPTASVFKVPVIVELYRQVEAGVVSLHDRFILREGDKVPGSGVLKELSSGLSISLQDLTELMMIVSDNTATDLIIEKLGMDKINEALRQLGLMKTVLVADCRDILFDLIDLDHLSDEEKTLSLFKEKDRMLKRKGTWSLGVAKNNVTTPNEMLQLLKMIVDGTAANPDSCDAILGTMGRCQTGGYRISKYLPQEKVEVAHKTGSLPGIRNDVGIVTLLSSNDRYIISCLTKEASDNIAAEELIANISKKVFDRFSSRSMEHFLKPE